MSRSTPREAECAPEAEDAPEAAGASAPEAESITRCDEPYLDGLFTYCLSVMCEHEAAIAAVGETLALAERQRSRGRAPAAAEAHRPWLYALARWACSRRLSEQRARERASGPHGRESGAAGRESATEGGGAGERGPAPRRARGGGPLPRSPLRDGPFAPPAPSASATPAAPPSPRRSAAPSATGADRARRRRELAALAWPEAAGTSPEQREALELSVRHGLPAEEIAAVLSLVPEAAEDLLSHAACEVERTRAALCVVESGGCPAVSRLAGDDRLLLGTALRRELVWHVDGCGQCRRAAERAMAGVSWPGTAPVAGSLVMLEAPVPAVRAAAALARRARAQRAPRFDRAGFPLDDKCRAARRDRLRSKALATTVVATVLAAPVLALWAAYRGGGGESPADRSVSAVEKNREKGGDSGPTGLDSLDGPPSERAGRGGGSGARTQEAGRRSGAAGAGAGVEAGVGPGAGAASGAEIRSEAGAASGAEIRSEAGAGASASGGVGVEVESPGGTRRSGKGPGRLTVEAQPLGDGSFLTLTATGGAPVRWSASPDAPWLVLSRTGGTLRPGESAAVRVLVDHAREPAAPWTARVRVDPALAVITLTGSPSRPPTPPPPATTQPETAPAPSPPAETHSPAPAPAPS
ncbi:hypothetical protein GCM10009863_20590 [Streptomyces axinellae]|uniref:BACON domain-containing protein n=1 Tax=Streptomyces axinellae TaxID=552788 RepID=A0ABN3PZU1_9ACTN